jgi:mannose-1-phosphate guanylyltransferase
MDAMILAAGLGTRLLPLTRLRPKPLFPILNRPLLNITLAYLSRFSLERAVINSHHLASQIASFVHMEQSACLFEIKISFEPEILGTGGGIARTRDFWRSDPFLVINSDILIDIDLEKAITFHRSHKGPVTLILHDYPAFNQIAVDDQGCIQNFRQEEGLAFTGIHILDRVIFDFMPSSGPFEIIPVYQKMIKEGQPIRAYVSHDHYWRDIGTPESYLAIHEELLTGKADPHKIISSPPEIKKSFYIHPEAKIEKGVVLSGWVCIGKGCLLKKGARVHNSVLWEEVVVEPGITVSQSIVASGVRVTKDLVGEVEIGGKESLVFSSCRT